MVKTDILAISNFAIISFKKDFSGKSQRTQAPMYPGLSYVIQAVQIFINMTICNLFAVLKEVLTKNS